MFRIRTRSELGVVTLNGSSTQPRTYKTEYQDSDRGHHTKGSIYSEKPYITRWQCYLFGIISSILTAQWMIEATSAISNWVDWYRSNTAHSTTPLRPVNGGKTGMRREEKGHVSSERQKRVCFHWTHLQREHIWIPLSHEGVSEVSEPVNRASKRIECSEAERCGASERT